MRVLDAGHRYALKNLRSEGETELAFFKDPKIHGDGHAGTSCQEVLRALIDRVIQLDSEKPHPFNQEIVSHARQMIALFEARALLNKATEKHFAIEQLATASDGHLMLVDGELGQSLSSTSL